MFDKKIVDAYKEISAPEELKERVMSSCLDEKTSERGSFSRNLRMYATLAACFVLIVAFSVFAVGNFGDLSVSVYGKTLTSEPMALSEPDTAPIAYSAGPRMVRRMTVPLELEVDSETEISVSGGVMRVCDAVTEEELYSGTGEYTASADLIVYWTVDADEEETHFEMAVNGRKKSYVLLLDYDEEAELWTICRKKTER